jgi:hypothetical protein
MEEETRVRCWKKSNLSPGNHHESWSTSYGIRIWSFNRLNRLQTY